MTLYHDHNQAKSNGFFGSALGSGPPDDLRGIRHGGQGAPADISHLAFALNPGYCFFEAAPFPGMGWLVSVTITAPEPLRELSTK
jgi:hypothetical protein